MIDEDTLNVWRAWAKLDGWHYLFVGSDIRQMIGEIDRLRARIKELEHERNNPGTTG